jgi:zinc protease
VNRARRIAVLASLLLFAAGAFAQVTDHRDIKTPPLRQFSMPQPKRIQLANGMVIFLQEDRELPLIRGFATIRGGSRNVPNEKAGLINIYSQAWRTGGTASQTGDQLDELLESRAAVLEAGGGIDSTNVSMDVLKGDFDTVFPIFVDLLRNPQFRQDKIDLAKTQANTAISRRNDEPGSIIGRELIKLGYGSDSPYAQQTEYATIASINRDDLLAFHKRTVHPNNIILSFIGDFDSARLEKRLRDTFSSWTRGPQISRPDIAPAPAAPGIYFVPKDDVTQANIGMVHPGIDRSNPDFYALAVMNEIFSGGFSGRLMQSLRSQRGLTYGVSGRVGANWDYPGLFRVQMATKSETTLEAIAALREEIDKLIGGTVTPEELALAKESILNAFVFTMDTRGKALNQQVLLEFYGFPSDYYTRYPQHIAKVTADDVSRVARTYIHPDQLAVLVIGREAEFEQPLSTLGEVTTIDITIPAVDAGQQSAAPTGSNAEGMALLGRFVDFVGGREAIDAVTSLRSSGTRTMNTPQGEMSAETVTLIQYPSNVRQEMTLPMGQIITVIAPQGAFVITPMGVQDLPSSQRDAALGDLRTDFFHILKNAVDAAYIFSAGGTERVGDIEARVLDISASGAAVRWYIDPADGRLFRTVRSSQGPGGGEIVTDYSDWKAFGGITMATHSRMSRNGEPAGEMRVTSVEINPPVAGDTFAKP